MAISPQRLTIYLYSAHRAVIFAIAQLSCFSWGPLPAHQWRCALGAPKPTPLVVRCRGKSYDSDRHTLRHGNLHVKVVGRHRLMSLCRPRCHPMSSDKDQASRHPALSYDVVRSVNTTLFSHLLVASTIPYGSWRGRKHDWISRCYPRVDLGFRGRLRSCQPLLYILHWISRKPLEIETIITKGPPTGNGISYRALVVRLGSACNEKCDGFYSTSAETGIALPLCQLPLQVWKNKKPTPSCRSDSRPYCLTANNLIIYDTAVGVTGLCVLEDHTTRVKLMGLTWFDC